ncbi:hypothetical protein TELCIR_19219 [Teladorsagia circumcincta]|uniref:RNA-directed DNA polymerase n=1 Tax=Teladorsagia circumcincta TaxID=45464 RepID=A0A2G9TMV5_TELCI|nr:hypothetical protein TELCIR_19219 [Teladorsagia circumcincta]
MSRGEVSVYIDDILIATDTEKRHYEELTEVLKALQNAHLRVKPQKCKLMGSKIAFLGHIIDQKGVHTDPDKIEKIIQYPQPKNLAELRAFLGLAGYYREFVFTFSHIAKPLCDITSTKIQYRWGRDQEEPFNTLKTAISTAPVLAQPDIEKARDGTRPFYLYTDATQDGVGVVLPQESDDGIIHPVYFTSKPLSKNERNCHITDQEALALIDSLKKFHYFVYGVRTIVKTDNAPLTSLFKERNVSPRVLRWALEVQ